MRNRIGWIGLFAVLTAAGVSIYSLLEDERYSATASLLLGPSTSSVPLGLADRDTIARRTERRFAHSGNIAAENAVDSLELRSHGKSGLDVEATARDPRTVALVANTYAEEVVAFRRGNAEVVGRATPPGSPSSPKPLRNTLIGGLAGLLLGFGVALARDKLDRRLRNAADLEEAFGMPVLASVPDSYALGRRCGMAHDLPPEEAEAFQTLRANLRRFERDRQVDSVLVTSAAAQDGKSTVAFNLAAAAAATGLEVLLVEAEVRKPSLARALGLPTDDGLTSVLMGEAKLEDACHEVLLTSGGNSRDPQPTINLLLAGGWRADAGKLVESERMRELIRTCRRSYSLVVVDTPPAGLVSDPISLMSDVSAVVIVGRIGKLKSEQAARLREELEKVSAPTLGVVANFASWS